MKKNILLTVVISFFVSACLPAPVTDIPIPTIDLDATAAVFVQQTLAAMPSVTVPPSNTPVVVVETATVSASETPTLQTETATVVQTLTTETTGTLATVIAATNTTITGTGTQLTNIGTSTNTLTATSNIGATPTETLHSRFYGTLPPNIPYNGLELVNKSKAEAYISLQVTVADGSTTILEYPVGGLFSIQAPVGKYKYVAWVGGNKIIGSFVLDRDNDVRITIYKDRIEVKTR